MRNTKPGSWQNVVGLKATIGMVYVLNFLLLRRHPHALLIGLTIIASLPCYYF